MFCIVFDLHYLCNRIYYQPNMNSKSFLTMAALIVVMTMARAQKSPVAYVDPFIGTTNFSVCNPGAVRPHGLMSVVPFNVMGSDLNVQDKDARWWSAPYEYANRNKRIHRSFDV